MKMRLNITVISSLWLCTILLLTNCTDEVMVSQGVTGGGKPVSVSLSFALSPVSVPEGEPAAESKSNTPDRTFCIRTDTVPPASADSGRTRADGSTRLYNLWVFQFDAAGKTVAVEKLSETPAAVNGQMTVRARLIPGTGQTLYLVSLGEWCNRDLSAIGSVGELEKLEIDYLSEQEGAFNTLIKGDNDLPYAGRADGVDIVQLEDATGEGLVRYNPDNGFTGSIRVKCLVAKVSFHFNYQVPDYSLLGINIKSVPTVFGIVPGNTSGSSYRDLLVVDDNAITEVDENGRRVVSWYVAQNRSGVNPAIQTESDRYSDNAPANATNLELWASKRTATDEFAIYSIYIGGNNTSDFNIDANGSYRLHTDINGKPSDNDKRIKDLSLTQNIELYCASSKGTDYNLDTHYDWRPLTVTTTGKKITIEILGTDENPGEDISWLKVSPYSNYTEALNNRSLFTRLETRVPFPSKNRFYLYNDEYPVPDAPNRSLRVKVTTTGLAGSQDKTQTFTVTQESTSYLGRFGGELDLADGQYTKLLGAERKEENSFVFSSDFPLPPRTVAWGFYGINIKDYGVRNKQSGFTATRMMVENPNGYKVGLSGVAEPVIRDGTPDLYQYTYYNTYLARYCFDKNRDLDGNGKIDYRPGDPSNELKWYMPSVGQVSIIRVQILTTTSNDNFSAYLYLNPHFKFNYSKSQPNNTRCVRDLD